MQAPQPETMPKEFDVGCFLALRESNGLIQTYEKIADAVDPRTLIAGDVGTWECG
jgi:hypothetical protein